MTRRLSLAAMLLAGILSGCTLTPPAAPGAAGGVSGQSPPQILAQVQQAADRMDTVQDGGERAQLLATASASAASCMARAPTDATCLYAQAQVQGLTARERPLQASALLKDMLASLKKAEALDPVLDHAGPARLSAVVLMRAPPWPLGPGDAESATDAAQRAVRRDAAYPPNLITLAQAQSKTDGATAARATFAKAQAAVAAWTVAADQAQWQAQIDQGLHGLQ